MNNLYNTPNIGELIESSIINKVQKVSIKKVIFISFLISIICTLLLICVFFFTINRKLFQQVAELNDQIIHNSGKINQIITKDNKSINNSQANRTSPEVCGYKESDIENIILKSINLDNIYSIRYRGLWSNNCETYVYEVGPSKSSVYTKSPNYMGVWVYHPLNHTNKQLIQNDFIVNPEIKKFFTNNLVLVGHEVYNVNTYQNVDSSVYNSADWTLFRQEGFNWMFLIPQDYIFDYEKSLKVKESLNTTNIKYNSVVFIYKNFKIEFFSDSTYQLTQPDNTNIISPYKCTRHREINGLLIKCSANANKYAPEVVITSPDESVEEHPYELQDLFLNILPNIKPINQ